MAGVSIIAGGKTFTKTIGRRPLTLEQRIAELAADTRANRMADWTLQAGVGGNLYQDLACTIPVMAVGDPVHVIVDRQGHGHNWVAISDAARGPYKLDGAIPYIEGDGITTQYKLAASGNGITSFANYTLCSMGFLADQISTYRFLFQINTESNSARLSLGTGPDANKFQAALLRKAYEASVYAVLDKPAGRHLWTIDLRNKLGTGTLIRDKTAASASVNLTTAGISSGDLSVGAWLFAFNSTSYGKGRFYGGILLSSENDITGAKADIEEYLMAKMGI